MFSVVHDFNLIKFFTTKCAANTREQETNKAETTNKNVFNESCL